MTCEGVVDVEEGGDLGGLRVLQPGDEAVCFVVERGLEEQFSTNRTSNVLQG